MKVFLLLNGSDGCQTGIEDGFNALLKDGRVSALKWAYFNALISQHGASKGLLVIENELEEFQPDLVVIFHVGNTPVSRSFIERIKRLGSRPIVAYDEGDMYGGWAKPLTRAAKTAMTMADVVSIRGLGRFHDEVRKLNKNVVYTPHHADIARFDTSTGVLVSRKHKVAFIGNRVGTGLGSLLRRLPGAPERERYVRDIGQAFPRDFALYGAGWNGFTGNRGSVDFYQQLEVYRQSWLTVAYEHYPSIPHYFSNRLPIALLAGAIYVCHEHQGYENQFKGLDFIFFHKTNREAIDLIHYLLSLDSSNLLQRSRSAREFAQRNFLPDVVWANFFDNILEKVRG